MSASGKIFGRLQEQVCTQLYRIGGSAVRNGRCLKLLELAGRSGSHKVLDDDSYFYTISSDAMIVREFEEYTARP